MRANLESSLLYPLITMLSDIFHFHIVCSPSSVLHFHPFYPFNPLSWKFPISFGTLWAEYLLGQNFNSGKEPWISMGPLHIYLIHLRLLRKNIFGTNIWRTGPECQLFRMWSANLQHLSTEICESVGSFTFMVTSLVATLALISTTMTGSLWNKTGPGYPWTNHTTCCTLKH